MSLIAAQLEVAASMDRIKTGFKPGVKITVLVRTPDYPDQDFLMTDDTDTEIMAAIERRMSK